jgi:hypothetical protein
MLDVKDYKNVTRPEYVILIVFQQKKIIYRECINVMFIRTLPLSLKTLVFNGHSSWTTYVSFAKIQEFLCLSPHQCLIHIFLLVRQVSYHLPGGKTIEASSYPS